MNTVTDSKPTHSAATDDGLIHYADPREHPYTMCGIRFDSPLEGYGRSDEPDRECVVCLDTVGWPWWLDGAVGFVARVHGRWLEAARRTFGLGEDQET